MDVKSRSKWYLKNLLHCKDNGGIMITHEYLKNHIHELQKDITPALFESWEMRPFSFEELEDVEQYIIPDEIFYDKEKKSNGRTEMLSELHSSCWPEFENCLIDIFENIQKKHNGERIEGVFHCLAAYKSLIKVCEEKKIPLIQYSFSAFRKTSGYRETQFYTALDGRLYCDNKCECHYNSFMSDNRHKRLPVFSNRELIAIFGKERTLPMIPLMDHKPQYEMGVCCECFSILPQFYLNYRITDDDIFYNVEPLYEKNQIKVRSHSIQLDQIQVDRTTQRNDPAPFLLSCRRLAAVRSQIILKAMLWKRTAIMEKNTLDYSFACAKDYASTSLADIRFLNYYLIGYTVPSGLMFSYDYWRWRLSNPSEVDVFDYHLKFYCKDLGIENSIVEIKDESKRFKLLLESRKCDDDLIPILLDTNQNFEINYDALTSKFVVNGKSHWRLNKKTPDGNLYCKMRIENIDTNQIEFYPLDDVAGFSKINKVEVNGKELILTTKQKDWNYLQKVKGHYVFQVEPEKKDFISVIIEWQFNNVSDFLITNQNSIQ